MIRFNEKVADYIREKRWHPSQQLRELKRGGVELRLNLSSLAEIERWVLSWGANAVVIKPPELVLARQAGGQADPALKIGTTKSPRSKPRMPICKTRSISQAQ